MGDIELRKLLLEFDKSRGQTGIDYVEGKITHQQADSEFEDDIAKVITWHQAEQRQLLERLMEEIDQIEKHTDRDEMHSDVGQLREFIELRLDALGKGGA